MPSAKVTVEVSRKYLLTEVAAGGVLGPLDSAKYIQVHTSRFGNIPKSTPGKWRLTVDMSSPEGVSVNDGIL